MYNNKYISTYMYIMYEYKYINKYSSSPPSTTTTSSTSGRALPAAPSPSAPTPPASPSAAAPRSCSTSRRTRQSTSRRRKSRWALIAVTSQKRRYYLQGVPSELRPGLGWFPPPCPAASAKFPSALAESGRQEHSKSMSTKPSLSSLGTQCTSGRRIQCKRSKWLTIDMSRSAEYWGQLEAAEKIKSVCHNTNMTSISASRMSWRSTLSSSVTPSSCSWKRSATRRSRTTRQRMRRRRTRYVNSTNINQYIPIYTNSNIYYYIIYILIILPLNPLGKEGRRRGRGQAQDRGRRRGRGCRQEGRGQEEEKDHQGGWDLQSGAASCSEGFVNGFLRVPLAVGVYCSSHAAQENKGNF